VGISPDRSHGFSRPVPARCSSTPLALSMTGLGLVLRTFPVGTGYAVWVDIGAVGTAVAGMIWLGQSTTVARILCLVFHRGRGPAEDLSLTQVPTLPQ
jgi:quaternary ammonium compound-resistance protein SugE